MRQLLIDCNHAFAYAERIDAQYDSVITLTHDMPRKLDRERNRGRIEGVGGTLLFILIIKTLLSL